MERLQTTCVVTIDRDSTAALRRLAFETRLWWPSCYEWRPRPAGHRTDGVGRWCDLGRIVRAGPGTELSVLWDPGDGGPPSPEIGGLVDMNVEALRDGRSRVRVRHSWPTPLVAEARFLHAALASPDGWPTILAAYAEAGKPGARNHLGRLAR